MMTVADKDNNYQIRGSNLKPRSKHTTGRAKDMKDEDKIKGRTHGLRHQPPGLNEI